MFIQCGEQEEAEDGMEEEGVRGCREEARKLER